MAPDTAPIEVDAAELELALINLALNARDAMQGSGQLDMAARNALPADLPAGLTGEFVLLEVADTGPGIPSHLAQQVFEPFFTTKPLGVGTGLGLSSAYGIVKQSGGDIRVSSEPGVGTTFRIYLPLMPESAGYAKRRATPSTGRPSAGVETVLLVEDDEALRALGRRVLEAKGYTVLVAASAEEALFLANGHPGDIDLVATDVVMPGMSGRSLVQYVAELHPRVRILFMSGYTNDDVLRRGALDPATAFLQKPFTPDQLSRRVREVLDAA